MGRIKVKSNKAVIIDAIVKQIEKGGDLVSIFGKEIYLLEDMLIRHFAKSLTNISSAKQKAKTIWAEKISSKLIAEWKKLVNNIKNNGDHISGNIYLYKGEYYKAEFCRSDIYGNLISI